VVDIKHVLDRSRHTIRESNLKLTISTIAIADALKAIQQSLRVLEKTGAQFLGGPLRTLATNTEAFFGALHCPKTLIRFTAAEGAGEHCEMMNRSLLNDRVLDWLVSVAATARCARRPAHDLLGS
jgi:hypothetical protein